jgi:2-oxoglutarate ferredoxin oxidoreductase subunit beta
MKGLAEMVVQSVKYPGFGLVNALSPCVTFRGRDEFDRVKGRAYEPEHDNSNLNKALEVAAHRDQLPLGILYKEDPAPPCWPPREAASCLEGQEPEWATLLDQFRV